MRKGVTLLEVLVAMLVLVIGLMGIAALLPVAAFYKGEANMYDRTAVLGGSAYNDTLIRGYADPRVWLDPFGNYAVQPFGGFGQTTITSGGVPVAVPFVIDPLGLTYPANAATIPVQFPAVAGMTGTVPTIPRFNIDASYAWPGGSFAFQATPPASGQLPMGYALADRAFRSNDDLEFVIPANEYRPTALTGNVPQFVGDYSWLLFVSPDNDDLGKLDAFGLRRFDVDVVVFKKRDLDLDPTALDPDDAPPERLVYADLLEVSTQINAGAAFGVNVTGGSVRLRTPLPSLSPLVNASWLDVKPNDWILLSAVLNGGVAASGVPLQDGEWYRILGRGKTTQLADGSWYRDVQIAGPDWSSQGYVTNPPYVGYPGGANVFYQYATLCDGATMVYRNQVYLP